MAHNSIQAMSQSTAFCPDCKQEVEFVEGLFGRRECPLCGYSYVVGLGAREHSAAADAFLETAWPILRVFIWVCVFLLATAGVGLAIVFVGCNLIKQQMPH
jgi:rubredoxin